MIWNRTIHLNGDFCSTFGAAFIYASQLKWRHWSESLIQSSFDEIITSIDAGTKTELAKSKGYFPIRNKLLLCSNLESSETWGRKFQLTQKKNDRKRLNSTVFWVFLSRNITTWITDILRHSSPKIDSDLFTCKWAIRLPKMFVPADKVVPFQESITDTNKITVSEINSKYQLFILH